MENIGRAFAYIGYSLKEFFRRWPVMRALLCFAIGGLAVGAATWGLIYLCLQYLGLTFTSQLLIGAVLGMFLFSLYYLFILLKASTIRAYISAITTSETLKEDQPGLAGEALRLALAGSWLPMRAATTTSQDQPSTPRQGWHLVLPVMASQNQSLEEAVRAVDALRANGPLRVDPGRVNVQAVTTLFTILAALAGTGLAIWLSATLTAGGVVTLTTRTLSVGVGLLTFLMFVLPILGLSGVIMGFYQGDLLRFETRPAAFDSPRDESPLEYLLEHPDL